MNNRVINKGNHEMDFFQNSPAADSRVVVKISKANNNPRITQRA